jgi:transposase
MKPYSDDLRKKAVLQAKSGKYKLKQISTMYEIDPKTLYRWIKSYDETKSFSPKRGYQKGHSHMIPDLEEFKKIVEEGNFSTIAEIRDHIKIGSLSSIRRSLKKINFVKKKAQKRYKEQDPEKVTEYMNIINGLDKKKFVYVDESGFEKKVPKNISTCKKELKRK